MPDILDRQRLLTRTMDADAVNRVANDPSVRPFVGGEGVLDLTAVVRSPLNIVLWGDAGGFVWAWSAPATFEVHTLILPEGRGKWATRAAREAMATMAATYEARHLWTRVRRDLTHVRRFAMAAGLQLCGEAWFDFGDGTRLYDILEWRTPCR